MDTGKILMGTAMVMLMIGLLVHPAGAASTSGITLVGEKTVSGGSGQALVDGVIPDTPSGPLCTAIHPYERLTIVHADEATEQ